MIDLGTVLGRIDVRFADRRASLERPAAGNIECAGPSAKMISVAFRSSIGRAAIASMRAAATTCFF
jgi:hypothetical protein